MVFLTGASGFLGKSISRFLLKENIRVFALSRQNQTEKNIFWQKADLRGDNLPSDLLSECKTIVHCAAAIKGSQEELDRVNYLGTKKLVELAKKSGIEKFIFISSIDVLLSDTAYARSKKKAEEVVMDSGLNWLIIRPSVIFGENDTKNFEVLEKFIRKFPALLLPCGGSFLWEPVYVEDLAGFTVEQALASEEVNKAFNVVGPQVLSFKQIISLLEQHNNIERIKISLPTLVVKLLCKFLKLLPGNVSDVLSSFQDKVVSRSSSETIKMPTSFSQIYSCQRCK
jgi:NADH dehydrogenase